MKLARQSRNREVLQFETLEARDLLASDWQNPVDPVNVDGLGGDGASPVDALHVIQELSHPTRSDPRTFALPQLGPEEGSPPPFLDVNGDQFVSPLDALLVVRALQTPAHAADQQPLRAPDHFVVGLPASERVVAGQDTLVNQQTRGVQSSSSVAALDDGGFVAVWTSVGQDGSSTGVYGQRYDATGAKVAEEFRVNSAIRRSQEAPAVAAGSDGGFTIAWQSLAQDGSGWGVYAQMFDEAGGREGAEFRVNQTTLGNQFSPAVASLDSGQTVFTWEGRGRGDTRGVFVRSFDTLGAPLGNERLVNTTVDGLQRHPAVVATGEERYVVSWDGRGGGGTGIHLRAFDGTLAMPVVFVGGGNSAEASSLAADSEGNLVVAWNVRPELAGRSSGVRGRLYDAALNPLGGIIRVNQTTAGQQTYVSVDFLDDDTLAFVWSGRGAGDRMGVYGRMFDATGAALRDEQLVNQTTESRQYRPAIAGLTHGYVTLWEGFGDADANGIYSRFMSANGGSNPQYAIQGSVFVDANGDGQQAAEEAAAAENVTVTLRDASGTLVETTSVAVDGSYQFNAFAGDYLVEVNAEGVPTADPDGTLDQQTSLTLTTDMAGLNFGYNRQPLANSINCPTAVEGVPFLCDISTSFTEPDGSPLVYAIAGASWATINAEGQLSGTPLAADIGSANVTVVGTDPGGLFASAPAPLTVEAAPPAEYAIRGTIFGDRQSNGIWDGDETGIAGVTVYLRDQTGATMQAVQTDSRGLYEFQQVHGNYTVWVAPPGQGTADPDPVLDDRTSLNLSADVEGLNFGYNRAPAVTPVGQVTVMQGEFLSLPANACLMDPEGGTLTYEVDTLLPTWLSFDPDPGVLEGIPGTTDTAPIDVSIKAIDAAGLESTCEVEVVVLVPQVISGSVFGDANADGLLDGAEAGVDGALVTLFDLDNQLIGSTVADATGAYELSAIPGSYLLRVSARGLQTTDPDAAFDSMTLLEVDGPTTGVNFGYNRAPAGTLSDQIAIVGEPFVLEATSTISDPDGSPLTFDPIEGLPVWLRFDEMTGSFSGTPMATDLGADALTVSATDAGGLRSVFSFLISVQSDSGDPPVIAPIGNQTATLDCGYQQQVTATDPEGGTLSYAITTSANNQISWLAISGSGLITGSPPLLGGAQFVDVKVTVTDSGGQASEEIFSLQVIEDIAPVLAEVGDQTLDESTSRSIQIVASDPNDEDCGALVYALEDGPSWVTVHPVTGLIDIDAPELSSEEQPLVETVQFSVDDGVNSKVTQSFTVTVRQDDASLVAPGPQLELGNGQRIWEETNPLPPATVASPAAPVVLQTFTIKPLTPARSVLPEVAETDRLFALHEDAWRPL
ncbi:MAG: putative Ig domain-containing protein [Planctomycetota bacterium]